MRITRRAFAATGALAVLGQFPGVSTARASTDGGVGIPVPRRDLKVSPERIRQVAVAFHDVAAENLDLALDKMVEARVHRSQVVASWQFICPEEGRYNWAMMDRYFAAASSRGITTLIHINSTPDWVHPDLVDTVPNYGERIWYPPTRNADELAAFSDFVSTLTGRYRGRVESYEIWNEENWRDFYKPVEDPADYATLLRAGYLAVKDADPGALVVFGGTTRSDPGFLREVYHAASAYPDASRNRFFFDVMGVHPYTDDRHPDNHDPAKVRENAAGGEFDDNFLGIDRVHAEMVRHGDGDKPIHLGEFSYSTIPTWMGQVPDARRAFYLRRAYELAAQRPYVSGLAWFLWSESKPNDDWHGWTLLEYPATPTGSYLALQALTSTASQAPALKLRQNANTIEVSASGYSAAIERAELYAEGVQVASSTELPLTWSPPVSMRGTTNLAQLVLYTQDGRTLQTNPRFVALGGQMVQVSHASVKASRNVEVNVGTRVVGPATLHAADANGTNVLAVPLGVGTGTWTRMDALVALDHPGTYQLSAHDSRGRSIAAPSRVTVI